MFTKIAAWFAAPIVSLLCKDERFLASVAGLLDNDDIAAHIAYSKKVEDIAKHIDKGRLAEVICYTLDISDLAGEFDVSAIASEIDLSDLASAVEIDVDEVTVDYKVLAKALIRELGAANKVECRPSAT